MNATVTITYVGGEQHDYTHPETLGLGFDAKLGWVSVYENGEEHSHRWEWIRSIASTGDVKLMNLEEDAAG